jgi:hypothetical protein
MWTGAVVAAMWSPHQAATTPAWPTSSWLAATWTPHSPRCPSPFGSGCSSGSPSGPPPRVVPLPLADGTEHPYARAALAEELGRVAAAPVGERNRRLWEAGRNLYNLVATGALDERQVHRGLLQAAQRCGLLAEEPRQTRRTLASARQVGLAHPRQVPERATPERRQEPASVPAGRARGGPARERR